MNANLAVLYGEFSNLYRDIWRLCFSCRDHDCEGFVWLLGDEAKQLYDIGVPIVEVNGRVSFIHSFEECEGSLLIEKPKPPCVLRMAGKCSAYADRPLVCRMYPVGLANINGDISLVLHLDCAFSRSLTTETKRQFFDNVVRIFRSVPTGTVRDMVECFRHVDEVSSFPDGPNSCEVIVSLEEWR